MTRIPELVPFGAGDGARSVVLVLPGGAVRSHGRYFKFVEIVLRRLVRKLTEADDGLAVRLLRYRYRGWNGADADTLADTRWALDRIRAEHGRAPVALVGNSLGGRAAFRAAGDPSVVSVVGVAPWLPAGEPVEQLAGRRVLIMHGDRDRSDASAAMSLAYARQARAVVPDLVRFEVTGDGHYLLRRADDCWDLATAFVTATIGTAGLRPAIAEAMAGDDLRVPL